MKFVCCICGLPSSGGSHNPHPIYEAKTGSWNVQDNFACGTCNAEVVLPTRNLLRKRRAKVAKMQARVCAERTQGNDQ